MKEKDFEKKKKEKECVGVQNDRYATWAVGAVEAEHFAYDFLLFFFFIHHPLYPFIRIKLINYHYNNFKLVGIYKFDISSKIDS